LGAQPIQERFIVTTQLYILQPLAIQERIVGQVQLAITQDFRITSIHSKCLSYLVWLAFPLPSKPSIEAHFELFCRDAEVSQNMAGNDRRGNRRKREQTANDSKQGQRQRNSARSTDVTAAGKPVYAPLPAGMEAARLGTKVTSLLSFRAIKSRFVKG
jgi:hypothetical protein